jgi:hypothetical protein
LADFLLLYGPGGKMPETEEEQTAVMAAWDKWFADIGSALKDGGNPTTPAAKQIGTDGSVSDVQATVSGYTIITADSLDEATAMAKGCPVLAGGSSITVLETFNVM